MDCPIETRHTTGVILDYCAGRLAPDRAAAIEAHARLCLGCREMIDAQRAVWKALDGWDANPPSDDFDCKLYARIDEEERALGAFEKWMQSLVARWAPFSWRAPVAVAAACVTVALAILIDIPGTPRVAAPTEPQARTEHLDIEQVERTLDDMNMLRQFAPVPQPSDPASSSSM
jgi:hypothetical protein